MGHRRGRRRGVRSNIVQSPILLEQCVYLTDYAVMQTYLVV